MLSSLLATSEGVIDVIMNVRTFKFMITSITVRKSVDGKTGGIDTRHFKNLISMPPENSWDSSWDGDCVKH